MADLLNIFVTVLSFKNLWLSLFQNAFTLRFALLQGEPMVQIVCICLSTVTTAPGTAQFPKDYLSAEAN